jgi:hypothetical protein
MRPRSILSLVAILLLVGCALPDPGELPGDPLPVERFAEEGRPLNLQSGMHVSGRLVIRDAASLREAWPQIAPRAEQADLPDTYFERETVLVAAMGMRPTGGHSILIDRAFLQGDTVSVIVRSISPGADCMVTQVITHPVDAARIPVAGLPVRFVERSEVTPCQ